MTGDNQTLAVNVGEGAVKSEVYLTDGTGSTDAIPSTYAFAAFVEKAYVMQNF